MRKLIFFICLTVVFAIPGWAQGSGTNFVLYLADPPVSRQYPRRELLRTPEAAAYRQQIETRQQALKRELASRNIRVTGSVSTLLNAVFATAPMSRIAELRSIPGVVGVRPMLRGKKHLNNATQLMNGPAAWTKFQGPQNAGAGMKIAIIDTGIDQTHPAFQDSSLPLPAGFPLCTNGHPEDCAYTSNKVIVARSYVRDLSGSDPATSSPDDFSPRDRDGHGTGVAAAAAGAQNSGTVGFTGMAPKAYLGNYKVYGSPGVNDFPAASIWIEAIDDAVSDGMDVANLSSGYPAVTGPLDTGAACGLPAPAASNPEYCDPLAAAFENAAKMGLIITVSVGNGGSSGFLTYPTYNSISSPATAPSVIGVGATTNSHVLQPAVTVTGAGVPANLAGIPAQLGDSYSFLFFAGATGASQAPLVDVTTLGDNGFACSSLPANSLAGAFALLQSKNASMRSATPCDWGTQSSNLYSAGAIGAVFYQATSAAPIHPENMFLFGPTVMISNAAGTALKTFIDANPGRAVIIDSAGVEQTLSAYSKAANFSPPLLPNQVASYSSFGPGPTGSVKPDLVATGGFDLGVDFATPDLGYTLGPDPADSFLPPPAGMYTAGQHYDPLGVMYSVNGYTAVNGTSFAAPLAAGAAALVKQAHPGLTPTQIKSLLVNSVSSAPLTDDINPTTPGVAPTPADVQRSGAGLMDAGAAVNATVTAEPATISFGFLTAGTLPMTQTLTITNTGSSSVALTAAVIQNNPSPGTTVAASGPGALGAGAKGNLAVTLSGSVPSPGEYSGFVTLQGGGASLRIPYMYIVGDGVPANVQSFGGGIGIPGQDTGLMVVQVVDHYGAPVTGSPVNFSVNPARSLNLQSVDGEPQCTPASSSSQLLCNTDNYGFAWIDVTLGPSPNSSSVDFTAGGFTCSELLFQCPSYVTMPQPAITSAGLVDPVAYSQPIAPGSYVSIFGSDLVDPFAVLDTVNGDSATALPSGALPLTLDGVTVTFDVPSAGISAPGYMYYVGPPSAAYPQINLWVPRELQGQTSAQVKVTVDESVQGNVVTVPLADYAPVFFANGGFLSARDSTANENVITASNPATRGQAVLLFANGMGPVTNPPASGDPASGANLSHTSTDPVVMIGNQQAQLLFSGLAPGFAGLYQVNVIVPTNISAGTQPVTLSIGGKTTPAGMLYVQ